MGRGAYFPAHSGDPDVGSPEAAAATDRRDDAVGHDVPDDGSQPWTATTYSLLLLRDFGLDPESARMRQTVALVRDNCHWEEGGQPYFTGEVEPCINGMTVALGAYFDQDVDGVVHPGQVHFELEDGDGQPSRWNSLRTLRVLQWYENAARP